MGWLLSSPPLRQADAPYFTRDASPVTDDMVSIHVKNTWNTPHRSGRGEEFAQTVLNMMSHDPVCAVAEAVLGEDMVNPLLPPAFSRPSLYVQPFRSCRNG